MTESVGKTKPPPQTSLWLMVRGILVATLTSCVALVVVLFTMFMQEPDVGPTMGDTMESSQALVLMYSFIIVPIALAICAGVFGISYMLLGLLGLVRRWIFPWIGLAATVVYVLVQDDQWAGTVQEAVLVAPVLACGWIIGYSFGRAAVPAVGRPLTQT